MKSLSILIFCCFSCFAFGQIDSTYNLENIDSNLVDTTEYTILIRAANPSERLLYYPFKHTVTKNKVDKPSNDTILIIEERIWLQRFMDVHCQPPIEDCVVWALYPKFRISNPITNEFDEYIILGDAADLNQFMADIPKLYLQKRTDDLNDKKYFVDNFQQNVPQIETTLIKYLGSLDKVFFYPIFYRQKDLKDWFIFVYVENDEIGFLNLETNRVIKKIPLEPK